MNTDLPPIPVWHARSFYAAILLVLSSLLNLFQIDLDGWLTSYGLLGQEDLLDKIMLVAPLVFGLWAWFERRAPCYRLSIHKQD